MRLKTDVLEYVERTCVCPEFFPQEKNRKSGEKVSVYGVSHFTTGKWTGHFRTLVLSANIFFVKKSIILSSLNVSLSVERINTSIFSR